MNHKFSTVEEYLSTFSDVVRQKLETVRKSIRSKAPHAVECIAYNMPAYKYKGKPLVYFAGYEKHIGFYATPTGHENFSDRLSSYKQGKGSVQFPLDEDMPLSLIEDMVRFRVEEMDEKLK